MKKENIVESKKRFISKVLIAPMTENEIEYALEVARELRQKDVNTEVFLEDKKLKAKFKYADKLNIPYVIVLGEEEYKNKNITIKNMQTGEQESLILSECLEKIK